MFDSEYNTNRKNLVDDIAKENIPTEFNKSEANENKINNNDNNNILSNIKNFNKENKNNEIVNEVSNRDKNIVLEPNKGKEKKKMKKCCGGVKNKEK